MKMEGRKIVLCITQSGAYMDISDDLGVRLLQSLLLQARIGRIHTCTSTEPELPAKKPNNSALLPPQKHYS